MEWLVSVLTRASSQNPAEISAAESELVKVQTEPGFQSKLLDIYLEQNNSFSVRSLAVIQLKNGVNKYWTKSAPK